MLVLLYDNCAIEISNRDPFHRVHVETERGVRMNTTNSTSESMQIVGGPSAAELIDAFKYAFDKERKFRVKFSERGMLMVAHNGKPLEEKMYMPQPVIVQIIGLMYESGTPGMFLFRANITDGSYRKGTVKGFYDANKRGGWFRYVR